MRIGIDGRLINETGVGRYIRNLIGELAMQDKTNEYIVFLRANAYGTFEPPNSRWTGVLAEVPWHTIAEQLIMPWVFLKARLDLVHIPYFNVPIFYSGKFIVTIHDLTILHFDTGKASTLPLPLYKLRRLGYYLALAVGLRRAHKIIAVSQTTKQEIINHFHIDSNKIVVTYEGVDEAIIRQKAISNKQKSIVLDPYYLYVGNAYPHKNLEMLLRALQGNSAKLVLVGKDDYFYKKIRQLVRSMKLESRVIFFGEAGDGQLTNLYTHARALVFPSLMEGFGLPALEALAFGCPVIASDIPVFHEILGEQATYFNPSDAQDLKEKLVSVGKRPKKFFNTYSWSTLASDTLKVYEHCLGV